MVADDYKAWRRQAGILLHADPNLEIICEVSDGQEAVRMAENLRPDLVLLDIGLPKLNGLEAARQIRKLAPKIKILFLTQESSVDVAHVALGMGALGYVVKAYAGTELLVAVQSALQGRQFVSEGLSGHNFAAPTAEQVPDQLFDEASRETLSANEKEIAHNHDARFYSDNASLVDGFATVAESHLNARNSVVVAASGLTREGILQKLQGKGFDIASAIREGRYIPLDAEEILSTFMVNDLPDPCRFFKIAGDVVQSAANAARGKYPRVLICGECAPALCVQGKPEAAIQLEHLCTELVKTYDLEIVCGYVMEGFDHDSKSRIFERICAEHTSVQYLTDIN
ncbi:MAG TPA: response regulator [Candidatus Acidoferrales bacterium]